MDFPFAHVGLMAVDPRHLDGGSGHAVQNTVQKFLTTHISIAVCTVLCVLGTKASESCRLYWEDLSDFISLF